MKKILLTLIIFGGLFFFSQGASALTGCCYMSGVQDSSKCSTKEEGDCTAAGFTGFKPGTPCANVFPECENPDETRVCCVKNRTDSNVFGPGNCQDNLTISDCNNTFGSEAGKFDGQCSTYTECGGAGAGTESNAGTADNCNAPCPAGAVCFANPLSVCSVKGLVMNILNGLQGVVALIGVVVIVIGGIWYMSSFGDEQAMGRAKKIIGTAVGGLALVLAAPSFIREILTILQGNPMDPGDINRALTIQQILLGVLNFLLSAVGLIAIIAMVIGGIMYLTSGGEEDSMKKGKQIFKYAIVGIIISIGALIIVRQITSIFNMANILG